MNEERKNLLVFGYGLSIILSFIGIRLGIKEGWPPSSFVLFSIAGVLIVITTLAINLLKPVYARWMKVAHFIGTAITCIILSIVFYLMFSVVGIILRILKKDLLDQKIDSSTDSYWIKREIEAFEKGHYTRQF